ncbi:MAG: hypothetical protein A2X34_02500 [Elusimicrobia bacterium GWC2_51_8]|nr:MAG: hypothetical protein A2X33_00875 [Elusimicrobia bacterium GWA2_51_34]OGR60178.1 MAG: hypothetical protein A2X34_02500 [Elusimicrobia bacterium GWC2_51_8]HAF94808.1 hypothetical protein [Elusimicrobiota bacterium]HCE98882.1 hypothetical protein [Elusimicrobiota bacterium]
MNKSGIKVIRRKQRLFVLGAGCSYEYFKLLTKDLFRRAYSLHKKHVSTELMRFLKYLYPKSISGHFVPNSVDIEDLLSTIDVAINVSVANDGGLFSKEGLEAIKRNLLGLVVRQLWVPGYQHDELYKNFVANILPSDSVITFNYDTLIDRELAERFNIPLERLYFKRTNGVPRLIKLHGSVNWTLKDGKVSTLGIGEIAKTNTDYAIVPPTLYKNPMALGQLWKEARQLIRVADEIFFIGYSMPQLDIPARYIFRRGIRMKEHASGDVNITVVNPDASVLNKYCCMLHPEIRFEKATFREYLAKHMGLKERYK